MKNRHNIFLMQKNIFLLYNKTKITWMVSCAYTTVYTIHCIQFTLYTVYSLHYALYTVYTINCIQFTLYSYLNSFISRLYFIFTIILNPIYYVNKSLLYFELHAKVSE